MDTVTQWEIAGCVEKISEQYLLPVIEAILHQFPFRIIGFHSDNGSEFVNYKVAKMLGDLLIEFTKSRANRSQDNALVEGKKCAFNWSVTNLRSKREPQACESFGPTSVQDRGPNQPDI